MQEIRDFLLWVLCLTAVVLVLNLILKSLSLPADVRVVISFLPLLAALAMMENQGYSRLGQKVMKYMIGFSLCFLALFATAFTLTLMV